MNAKAVSNMEGKFLSNVVKQATMKIVSDLKIPEETSPMSRDSERDHHGIPK